MHALETHLPFPREASPFPRKVFFFIPCTSSTGLSLNDLQKYAPDKQSLISWKM